jgi:hypothetical protein
MLSRSRQPIAFTPADLRPALWLEADAMHTLFTEVAGSTTPADTNTVGRWLDRSMTSFDVTATADDTTRPTWNLNSGRPYLAFNGTNSLLRRTAALGMYAAGACSIYAAMRSNAATGRQFVGERQTASATPLYELFVSAGDADDLGVLIRNDANTLTSPGATTTLTACADEVLDDTDFVMGFEDTGAIVRHYDDGALVDTDAYTRSGVLTLDRFEIGGSLHGTSHFSCRLYAMVIVLRTLTAQERAGLVTYLGRKAGLIL